MMGLMKGFTRKRGRRHTHPLLVLLIGAAGLPVLYAANGSAPVWLQDVFDALRDPTHVSGPAYVIDGDTIDIEGTRIRLADIDAPETRQSCLTRDGEVWACGKHVTEALREKIGAVPVRCEGQRQDRYQRLVATCIGGAEDLGGWLVRQGHAVSTSGTYAREEENARRVGHGIWQGDFVRPAEFRASERSPAGN